MTLPFFKNNKLFLFPVFFNRDMCHRKVVYFHENQLVYPVQKTKERDFQFGYNQILTALGKTILSKLLTFNEEKIYFEIFSAPMESCWGKLIHYVLEASEIVDLKLQPFSICRLKIAIGTNCEDQS